MTPAWAMPETAKATNSDLTNMIFDMATPGMNEFENPQESGGRKCSTLMPRFEKAANGLYQRQWLFHGCVLESYGALKKSKSRAHRMMDRVTFACLRQSKL